MAAVPLMVGGLSVNASANDGINILDNVKLKGEIRPRFETAQVKSNKKDRANAFTARTHLVATGDLLGVDGLTATVGIQSVNNFGYTNYNSTQNGETAYDVVADPQQAMLSEASIDYKIDKTALHAGRSHVNLDNQRFIGTVGWRQSERSYDTVYVANSSVENLNLLAAYVYGFAGVKSTTTADTNSVLLHANYKVMKELSITGYGYLLGSIHNTYGVALTGKVNAGAKLSYRAEYAMQSDATLETAHNGKPEADAHYYNLDLGANISGILAGINYEVLSANSGYKDDGKTKQNAFSTPLATAHKFNGWADEFLATPAGGLQDANIRLGYKAKGFGKVLAVYHTFTADEKMGGEDDLGTEFDAVYVNAIPGFKNLKGLVKLASYSKGKVTGYTNDKTVGWVQLDYKF
ncbi:hypothetical protein MNB_SM-5-1344 [hydrothermal vent metagenome]|uniref:Alginate export domain-containing protein n=1 Tax=hydrothermal vent metagenome TaxID=652676 RepID=A0A1W1CPQ7_9ZZZZ